ncbi:GatB/YqeY domain-containing protein [Bacteroidales bacterium OttesenSCG-928-B11]|nr:GatB/YqeY domain-containing protein [Bacteroidales bacterium OttesenSCG-928-E04]MDL2308933.1 GatB/YqeY domain-containing protein [Bacteroidales bacterium OttesenSCG-928-C03]MDL2312704.1 GatB/YqeY domain-containing protein [Bacteroidales bacterium OttesenSCG-928-B11]MDL2326264.1 GatB/YqeY domain-containing protein [Bacteroidales bacterium OttesenSCG-928-A14]
MNLETKINEDIKSAMLAKERKRLDALRAVKSALLLLKTEKGSDGEITEEAELKLLQKLVKQRKDSAALYKEQNRDDLYQEEVFQLEVIAQYLPEQLSDEEITSVVKQLIAEHNITNSKEMGKLMGLSSKALAGKADNKKVAEIVKKELGA